MLLPCANIPSNKRHVLWVKVVKCLLLCFSFSFFFLNSNLSMCEAKHGCSYPHKGSCLWMCLLCIPSLAPTLFSLGWPFLLYFNLYSVVNLWHVRKKCWIISLWSNTQHLLVEHYFQFKNTSFNRLNLLRKRKTNTKLKTVLSLLSQDSTELQT